MNNLDPQALGEWWVREHWLKYARVQSCDGFDYRRDDGGYRYVWMEAYVDGDMLQHYLLDVRTKADDETWEKRQFVGVSTMPTESGQPGPTVRVGVHDPVANFTDSTAVHRLRFALGMRWFADFVQASEAEAYGNDNDNAEEKA